MDPENTPRSSLLPSFLRRLHESCFSFGWHLILLFPGAFAGFVDVTGDLAQGTKDNEALRVFTASGYYLHSKQPEELITNRLEPDSGWNLLGSAALTPSRRRRILLHAESFNRQQPKPRSQMKMIIKKAFTIAALLILIPFALIRAQDASATTQPTSAQTQPLQGSWEGVQVGHESAGKYTITITGNSLHFQGPRTDDKYKAIFTLPAGTAPQQLHATITDSSDPDEIGMVVFAIFKIENGTLTLVRYAQKPPMFFEGDQDYRYDLKKVPNPDKPC